MATVVVQRIKIRITSKGNVHFHSSVIIRQSMMGVVIVYWVN